MPAKDKHHDVVKRGLVKAGWAIVRENYAIRIGLKRVWIDLSAVQPDQIKAAFIEVKGFNEPASVALLRDSVGQYILYRAAIKYAKLADTALFLAIPETAYDELFSKPIGKIVIEEAQMSLMVFDEQREEIAQWLPYRT
jgi:Holliday junction resolvase-like predicted endonuclease